MLATCHIALLIEELLSTWAVGCLLGAAHLSCIILFYLTCMLGLFISCSKYDIGQHACMLAALDLHA
jgi:hypothetical protein